MKLTRQDIKDVLEFVGKYDEFKRPCACGTITRTPPDRVVSLNAVAGHDDVVALQTQTPLYVIPFVCREDRCGAIRFVSVENIRASRTWTKWSADQLRRRAREERRALTVAEESFVAKAEALPFR
jgi:hypothetical protein